MTQTVRGAPDVIGSDPPPPPTHTYRPHVDGLRAVAVVMVVAYHAGVPGFAGGFTGVDVFFVISGYLIIAQLVGELERTGRIDLVAFWARRVRRLVPAALTVTVVTLAVGALVLDPLGTLQSTSKAAIAATAMVANLFFWKGEPVTYFGDHQPSPLLHTWSLSLEEQFYVLAAVGLLLVWAVAKRVGRARRSTIVAVLLAVFVVSLAVSVWGTAHNQAAAFYLPPTRAHEFVAGGLLALCVAPGRRLGRLVSHPVVGVVGLVAIVAVAAYAIPAAEFPGAWTLAPVAATVLLIGSGYAEGRRTPVERLLGSAPFVWVGQRSYSWYLWHWPVLVLAEAWNLGKLPLWAAVLCGVVSLGLADLSLRFVESPFRRPRGRRDRGHRAAPRAWRTVLVGAVASVLVMGTAAGVGLGARWARDAGPWPAIQAAELDEPTLPESCRTALNQTNAPYDTSCWLVGGVSDGRPLVAVWGDSHARHLAAGVEAVAHRSGVDFVLFARGACPPYDPAGTVGPVADGEPWNQQCDARNAEVLSTIRALAQQRPVAVVLSARWEVYLGRRPTGLADRVPSIEPLLHGYQARLTGLARGLSELDAARASTTLVLSTPEFARSLPRCTSAPLRPFACDVSRSRAVAFRAPATQFLRRVMTPSTSLADPLPLLCSSTDCPARETPLTYTDDDHLSTYGSLMLSPLWVKVMQAVHELEDNRD